MNKLLKIALLGCGMTQGLQAQTVKWYDNVKLSGYGIVQYQAHDRAASSENSFSLRLLRLSIDGSVDDFAYKVQMQANGNTSSLDASPRLVDLWADWQRHDFLRIKIGQFHRPFSFESSMHPVTQGFLSYGQAVNRLVGFSDRTGEQASNARDIGVMFHGTLLKNTSGRSLVGYQLGVFNGQGINVKDADNRKDVIGGAWIMPVAGLRIGAFGWTGSRGMSDVGPDGMSRVVSVGKNRYALSAEYQANDMTFRTEYIHSQGRGAVAASGDKADGGYALCILPVTRQRLYAKARYDVYRDSKTWGSATTYYEVGANYFFTPRLQLNAEYALVNERAAHSTYNLVNLQLSFSF